MEPDQVRQRVQQGFPGDRVTVTGDGSHFVVTVVSEQFAGLGPVKRQQRVYATVNDHLASGAIHAITIQTHTPAEWDKASKLKVS